MPKKNDFDVLYKYCMETTCGKCELLRTKGNVCTCEFKQSPRYWDVAKIRLVLKKFIKERDAWRKKRLRALNLIKSNAKENFKKLKPEDMIDIFEPQTGRNSVAYWKKELVRRRKEK